MGCSHLWLLQLQCNCLFARLAYRIANGFAFESALGGGLCDGGSLYGQRGVQCTAQALALRVRRFFKTQAATGIAFAG